MSLLVDKNLSDKYEFFKKCILKEGYLSLKSQYEGLPKEDISDIQQLTYSDNNYLIYDFFKFNLNYTTRNLLVMLHQLKMTKFLILDTETTGLNFSKDIPYQVAWVLVDYDFNIIEEFSGYVDINNPEYPVNPAIHNITTYEDIKDRLSAYINSDVVLVGHNISFDINMLNNVDIDLSPMQKYCTYQSRAVFKDKGLPNNKLSTIATAFGVTDTENAHEALFDCKMVLDVLKGIRRDYFAI